LAGLLCPCRCSRACRMPEPSTRDGGQLGKGTRALAQDVWPVCMCVWFSGAVLRICTRVLHHCVLLWFGGLLQSRGASPLRPIASPSDLYIPDLYISLSSRVSPLWTQSLRLSVPPGMTTPGTWQRVVMLNLRPSTSVPVSTLQVVYRKLLPTSDLTMPPRERTIRQIPSNTFRLMITGGCPPVVRPLRQLRPRSKRHAQPRAIGPSPWPSQLDT